MIHSESDIFIFKKSCKMIYKSERAETVILITDKKECRLITVENIYYCILIILFTNIGIATVTCPFDHRIK